LSVVPDCSFLSRALIETQLLPHAVDILDEWLGSEGQIVAPYHLQIEFSAALRSLERRRLITFEECDRTYRAFEALPITYNWDDAWVRRAIDIARAIGASRTYDSLYLACAESVGATLYTCDGAFARAVERVSPTVVLVD
jgi:predicted nucleic acid-binding protein